MRALNLIRNFSSIRRSALPAAAGSWRSYSNPPSSGPVKYSASEARSWKAEYTRSGAAGEDESAWFQPYVVTFSVGLFLLYFCALREESDVDDMIGASLYDRIDGLEEVQLRKLLEYNLDHGRDTRAIHARLKEIEEAKRQQTLVPA